ncbi:MAG: TlyA family RNA methyltransferase [Alphaproteobacteria bacterium]|nr:TlyA family RNA methyltransferase [Alphaproteobacteria bacterium]
MAKKFRLDELLIERGLADDIPKARAFIMSGIVFSGEKKLDKAGQQVPFDMPVLVRDKKLKWVSRGGLKLEKGLAFSGINPEGLTCIDVGCSTGGFTDVLLENGAAKVYAVDVGYGQLADKIRHDNRVVVMERTNARRITAEGIPDPIDLIVCDASFIGLQTVLPASMALAADGAYLIALIKPQFEVAKNQIGKGGVVRDSKLHEVVCNKISDWVNSLPNWEVKGITESPITGPKGNKEFLIVARKQSL